MTATPAPYAAKPRDDLRGSIPTQLADGRRLADSEGSEVVAEFSDEAASAFKGNRGSGLVNVLGVCELAGRSPTLT